MEKNKQGFQKGNQYGKLNKGEKSYCWKGEDAGYSAKHKWLYREFGKATKCKICGSKKNVEWASVDHKYTRERSNWLELCRSCHSRYDLGFTFKKGVWFKKCKQCERLLPLDSENFYLRSSGKFVYNCKDCCKKNIQEKRLLKKYNISYEDELDATEKVQKFDNQLIKN